MKEAIVRARVDSKLKSDAEAVFGTLGINTTEAIRMFLSQVRLRRGLPFIVGILATVQRQLEKTLATIRIDHQRQLKLPTGDN